MFCRGRDIFWSFKIQKWNNSYVNTKVIYWLGIWWLGKLNFYHHKDGLMLTIRKRWMYAMYLLFVPFGRSVTSFKHMWRVGRENPHKCCCTMDKYLILGLSITFLGGCEPYYLRMLCGIYTNKRYIVYHLFYSRGELIAMTEVVWVFIRLLLGILKKTIYIFNKNNKRFSHFCL